MNNLATLTTFMTECGACFRAPLILTVRGLKDLQSKEIEGQSQGLLYVYVITRVGGENLLSTIITSFNINRAILT